MRLRIRHKISYRFGEPTRNVTRILRLTPRSHEGQHVVAWQIDVDTDCILKSGEDGFGNLTHTFTARGPCEELTIAVFGEIDNFDAAGVVRGSAERMPIELYLRETPLTIADDDLRRFARATVQGCETPLEQLHGLLDAVHATVVFTADGPERDGAVAAFAARAGNGRDMAHVFTACARYLGHPARVASGYYLSADQTKGLVHAWSEIFVQGLGWTGFDAAHNICPQESHVRLATGLDCLAALPVRGAMSEAVVEELDIRAPFGVGWGQSQGGQTQSQGPGWQRQSQG